MLLSEASKLFLSTKEQEGFSPYTLNAYRIQQTLLIRDIGDVDISDVTLQQLRDHLKKEAKHLKPSSVAHKTRAIKSMFGWLMYEDYIEKNPALKLREPKQDQRIPKSLTVEEIELLRDACKTDLEHAMIEFFFATGARVGEVHKINIADVDLVKHSVIVDGKGRKFREVYFGAKASIWIKRYLDSRKDKEPCLFCSINKPYGRMSIMQIQRRMKVIASRCGLEHKVHPHVWRHSFAQSMLNNGAPLHTVQDLLGHDKPETTMLYLSLSGEARRQAYNRYFIQ